MRFLLVTFVEFVSLEFFLEVELSFVDPDRLPVKLNGKVGEIFEFIEVFG